MQIAIYSFLIFVWVIVAIALFYYAILEKKLKNKEEESYKKASKILEAANERAIALVEKATEKSKHILLGSEYLRQDLEQNMQMNLQLVLDKNIRELEGSSRKFGEHYEEMLTDVKREYLKQTEEILKDVALEEEKQLADFRKVVLQETIGTQKILGEKANKELERINRELEDYKQAQIGKIDKSVDIIVGKVLEKALGETLTLENHEKLIIQALEDAKQEGLFE